MIFSLFKKKPDKGQVAIRLAGTALKIQLMLGSAHGANIESDEFALGYLFGFHDGLLQVLGVPDVESLAITGVSFDGLLGDPAKAGVTLKQCLALAAAKNAEYLKGLMLGGEEALAWVRTQRPPMSLALHLQSNLGQTT